MALSNTDRRWPIGAEYVPGSGTHFRVWAPAAKNVQVLLRASSLEHTLSLEHEADGYFGGWAEHARPGDRYAFQLDQASVLLPDPASRFQPEGPHGFSQIVDSHAFRWSDDAWSGIELPGQVMYELHVGTFTPEGTYRAATRELAELAQVGITVIELMPVAEFAGEFGWGYDGVQLFAPSHLYGAPDDLRELINQAHHLGLGVLLDVVYNHFGPSGNYTGAFSPDYISRRHKTDWGEALNFDGPNSGPVREYFVTNATYWIREFHFDGLRLDATQSIYDDSADSILTAIGRAVRQGAGPRKAIVVAENEHQNILLATPEERGGNGLDALWNDDFHHSARVAMTGHSEFYYGDYLGTPQELISAVQWGFLYQGQWNKRQQAPRGTAALRAPANVFVNYLQNHDQVANSGRGLRAHLLTSPGRYRALTTLLLLAPGTPLLFQGQEFSATAPFFYFADHEVELAPLVRTGRQEFLRQFRNLAGSERTAEHIDPCAQSTFERSKLNLGERETHPEAYHLHKDLLALRKSDRVFASQRSDLIHGAVLGPEAFLLRWITEDDHDRLILINLGRDLTLLPAAQPLLAPPQQRHWNLLWSSDDPKYGGSGTALLDTRQWRLPGHAAIVLAAQPADTAPS